MGHICHFTKKQKGEYIVGNSDQKAIIKSLNPLKIIFSFMVFCLHYRGNMTPVYPVKALSFFYHYGGCAVEFFFVLSGFLMAYNYRDKLGGGENALRNFGSDGWLNYIPIFWLALSIPLCWRCWIRQLFTAGFMRIRK